MTDIDARGNFGDAAEVHAQLSSDQGAALPILRDHDFIGDEIERPLTKSRVPPPENAGAPDRAIESGAERRIRANAGIDAKL